MSTIKLTFNVPRVYTSSSVDKDRADLERDIYLRANGWAYGDSAYRQSAIYINTDYLYRPITEHITSGSNYGYDRARTVELGGIFEEIGGVDEAIGGGHQKVGSSNQ